MAALICMHIDDWALGLMGEDYRADLQQIVDQAVEQGNPIYNLHSNKWPAHMLCDRPDIMQIAYKDYISYDEQLVAAKRRLVDDGVTAAEACGWSIDFCIKHMIALMENHSENPAVIFTDAASLGWSEELYRRVLETIIPTKPIPGLCR
ncbi:MAG: hypothetical protein KKC75_07195 [Nanoarchaeota archaeon]|nr:hypothetical protein [Nanoarchaeota archaeon]MBU1005474.1 hypothetical protein [Nanoarchaeota archaeon]MBU1947044.1 hypothetical protein [Nanoarchaeota archaeon]